MEVQTFMSMIKVETLFKQFPISLIWQKYVTNVNMTDIKCNPENLINNESVIYDCTFDQFKDKERFLTTAEDKNSVSFIHFLC